MSVVFNFPIHFYWAFDSMTDTTVDYCRLPLGHLASISDLSKLILESDCAAYQPLITFRRSIHFAAGDSQHHRLSP